MKKKRKLNKNNIKILFILVSLFMLIFTIYETVNVYAVFYNEAQGTSKTNLSNWKIMINDTDVSSTTTKNFIIKKFNIKESTNVATDKIAPGLSGNFNIIIDPCNTQVSIKYEITIDISVFDNGKIILDSVKEINKNNVIKKVNENTYVGIITLTDINKKYINNIELSFKWENDESNNKKDTEIGSINNFKIEVPISIKINQYLGEV